MSAPLLLYRCATTVAAGIMPAWLRLRVMRGKELPQRWRERYGETQAARPDGPLVWVHAASVGETNSVMPLIGALVGRGLNVLLTTGTVTSERLVRGRLPANVVHQFAPLDHRPWLERFLAHWRPGLALRVDSELWPNTLAALTDRAIPVVQINARLSPKAYDGWRRRPGTARVVLGRLDLVCAQSEGDRTRFADLGARRAVAAGNLKLAQAPLPYDATALDALRVMIDGRPAWLAASIHPGEELIAGRAHADLKTQCPDVLTILVPRHPERGAEMTAKLQAQGLNVARRSLGERVTPDTDVYLADTMGELGLFYRACAVVFIGKTFSVGGGQNPAEPALIGCALAWGPDMSNFTELARDLEIRGAALAMQQPSDLGATIGALLTDRTKVDAMAAAGREYIGANAGALDQTLDLLAPYLQRLAMS